MHTLCDQLTWHRGYSFATFRCCFVGILQSMMGREHKTTYWALSTQIDGYDKWMQKQLSDDNFYLAKYRE